MLKKFMSEKLKGKGLVRRPSNKRKYNNKMDLK